MKTLKGMLEQQAELFNQGDLIAFFAAYADDCVFHNPNTPGVTNLEAYHQWEIKFLNAFRSMRFVPETLITTGTSAKGTCAFRYTISGIVNGSWRGFLADGKMVIFTGTQFFRVKNGLIIEVWELNDVISILDQMGVIPEALSGSVSATVPTADLFAA
jgi:predicted ester cyclase